jgi:hypothetical protein
VKAVGGLFWGLAEMRSGSIDGGTGGSGSFPLSRGLSRPENWPLTLARR